MPQKTTEKNAAHILQLLAEKKLIVEQLPKVYFRKLNQTSCWGTENNPDAAPATNFTTRRAQLRQTSQLKSALINQKRKTSQKCC